MSRYIDADALRESYRESIEECHKWADEMRESGNEEMVIRAEQSLGTFVECSLRAKNAPTIDVVPVVRGEWQVDEDGNVKCSVCGNGSSNDNFCEHCGADMRGKQDRTDDLISRRKAIDALIAEGRNVDSRYLESERIIHEADAVEAISMLPSAQTDFSEYCDRLWKRAYERGKAEARARAEIIRCKDCVHNRRPPESGNADCELYYGMTEQWGFCHMGDRR